MYPPFFVTGKNPVPEKRVFDKYSLRRLAQLCREGPGNVIGFHPEGTRNKNDDPYSYLRPQPGIGKLIKEANRRSYRCSSRVWVMICRNRFWKLVRRRQNPDTLWVTSGHVGIHRQKRSRKDL
jgi:1-acyl-sn-glycerol-3-phosphate acyltransferase